jgi:hypothetical protein
MPKIPFASDQVSAQGAKIQHPWAFNDTGAAIAQVGHIVSAEAEQWDKSISEARDTAETAKVKTEMIKDKMDLLDKFDQRDDYANFLPELKENHATNQEKYRGMVSSPKLWGKLQPQIMQDNLTDMVHVKQLARRKEIDSYKADYYTNTDFLEKQISTAPDVNTRNLLINELKGMSNSFVATGVIDKYTAAKRTEDVIKKGEYWGTVQMIEADPQKWLDTPNKEEIYGVSHLGPHEIYELNAKAIQVKRQDLSDKRAARQEEQQDKRDMWELNKGKIGDNMIKVSESGKEYSFAMLDRDSHDPKTGELLISPTDYIVMQNHIQARRQHLQVEGRENMNRLTPQKVVNFGRLYDEVIETGDRSTVDKAVMRGEITPQQGMALTGSISKADKSNPYLKAVDKYVDSFKQTFSSIGMGELRSDIIELKKTTQPDQLMDEVQKLITQKAPGELQRKLNERLSFIQPAGTPTPTKSINPVTPLKGLPELPDGWKWIPGEEGKRALDQNGKTKRWQN